MFDPARTIRYEELMTPLAEIKASLVEHYNSLYLDELEALMDKVHLQNAFRRSRYPAEP
jgi:phosphoenolpyruvate carboxylase